MPIRIIRIGSKALLVTFAVATFSLGPQALAADLDAENLKEVLRNVKIRRAPSIDAEVVTVLPGGFVVAVEPDLEGSDWYQLDDFPDRPFKGYVHKDYLADPTTSYEITKNKNLENQNLEFQTPWQKGYIWPQSHARIYDLDGTFISHLPRLKDLTNEYDAVNISVSQLASELPFYQLTYYSGGNHCCFFSRFISKHPFGAVEFDIPGKALSISVGDDQNSIRVPVYDSNYSYWLYSWANSPQPEVILTFSDGQVDVDERSMRKNPPSDDEFKVLVANQKAIFNRADSTVSTQAIGQLTGVMINLIYSGNATVARSYLNAVWSEELILSPGMLKDESITHRDEFYAALVKRMRRSEYFKPWML